MMKSEYICKSILKTVLLVRILFVAFVKISQLALEVPFLSGMECTKVGIWTQKLEFILVYTEGDFIKGLRVSIPALNSAAKFLKCVGCFYGMNKNEIDSGFKFVDRGLPLLFFLYAFTRTSSEAPVRMESCLAKVFKLWTIVIFKTTAFHHIMMKS